CSVLLICCTDVLADLAVHCGRRWCRLSDGEQRALPQLQRPGFAGAGAFRRYLAGGFDTGSDRCRPGHRIVQCVPDLCVVGSGPRLVPQKAKARLTTTASRPDPARAGISPGMFGLSVNRELWSLRCLSSNALPGLSLNLK